MACNNRNWQLGLAIAGLLFCVICTGSCGSSIPSDADVPASPVTINISPAAVSVFLGSTQTFVPSVHGTTNTAVAWGLTGPACSNGACGYIQSGGIYLAPQVLPDPPTVTITVVSAAEPSVTASATITLVPGLTVSLSGPQYVADNDQVQYYASAHPVQGANPDLEIGWSISSNGCGLSDCGSIGQTGVYVAPNQVVQMAAVTIIAGSYADPAIYASLTIDIVPAVFISPGSAVLLQGATQQFTASVWGGGNQSVVWTLSGPGCNSGGPQCGLIDSNGLYVAPSVPPSPPSVNVIATSVENQHSVAIAPVVISSQANPAPADLLWLLLN